ncbi:hypothetical protein [Mesorhizobium sp. M0276]|uniref:hypothetical protein n=1 Tax=Mesorhizobium sp. M0276 TaxID=2956928 RepID=UPI003338F48A
MSYELGVAAGKKAVLETEEATIKMDVDALTPEGKRQWLDGVIDAVEAAGRQVKGVRVETPTFQALGIKRESQNSGRYRNVIIVEAMLAAIGSPVEVVIEKA